MKCSGMCWTISIPGVVGGNSGIIFRKASAPPVEAPIAMILSYPELLQQCEELYKNYGTAQFKLDFYMCVTVQSLERFVDQLTSCTRADIKFDTPDK